LMYIGTLVPIAFASHRCHPESRAMVLCRRRNVCLYLHIYVHMGLHCGGDCQAYSRALPQGCLAPRDCFL
jgi:hypothetical protein